MACSQDDVKANVVTTEIGRLAGLGPRREATGAAMTATAVAVARATLTALAAPPPRSVMTNLANEEIPRLANSAGTRTPNTRAP